jgi:hypothetical protein
MLLAFVSRPACKTLQKQAQIGRICEGEMRRRNFPIRIAGKMAGWLAAAALFSRFTGMPP